MVDPAWQFLRQANWVESIARRLDLESSLRHADGPKKKSPFQRDQRNKSPDPFFRLYLTCRYIAGQRSAVLHHDLHWLFVVSPLSALAQTLTPGHWFLFRCLACGLAYSINRNRVIPSRMVTNDSYLLRHPRQNTL